MTNLILLSIVFFQTNITDRACRAPTGVWNTNYCWSVRLKVASPACKYVVEHKDSLVGPFPTISSGKTNGWIGQAWEQIDVTNVVLVAGTNFITLPVPPWEPQYFRLRIIP